MTQGRTFNTVGDLKQGLQGIPDDVKLGFGALDQSQAGGDGGGGSIGEGVPGGISMIHDGDRVTFAGLDQSQASAGVRSQS
jgi:hypothetical protein